MDKYGKITAPGTIRFERLLPGPVENVWAYLTESEKRGKWLATGDMELYMGGKVTLEFLHADLSPHKETLPDKYKYYEEGHGFTGRITRFEPPLLLAFTWADGSEVTFELIPQDGHVLLVLTHRRLGEDKDILVSVASGWHTHLGIWTDHLNGRIPRGFWEVHNLMEAEYQKFIKGFK